MYYCCPALYVLPPSPQGLATVCRSKCGKPDKLPGDKSRKVIMADVRQKPIKIARFEP